MSEVIYNKHGLCGHALYSVWEHMKARCYNRNFKQFKDYGGRGIYICDEWVNNPKAFIEWSLNNGWNEFLTIERIDNNKGYSPQNCTWGTKFQQSRNRRNNINITAFGETKCLTDWVKDTRCKVSFNQVRYRMQKIGWDAEKSLSEPSISEKGLISAFGEVKSVLSWVKDDRCSISADALFVRLKKLKWLPEDAITAKRGAASKILN